MVKNKIIFLMGPTAVGKTEVSVYLAKKIGAEIINCDSMQIYKELNICSSKPSKALRKKVPHHLFDYVSALRTHSVYQYCVEARRKIKEIIERGKTPLFVGGTGLYMRAVIDGLFPDEKVDLKLRASLGKLSAEKLFEELKKLDPASAKLIHPNNKKRLVRALEVYYKNKEPLSSLKKKAESIEDKYDIRIFFLNMPRQALYERINERVDKMFRRGLMAEVRKLSARKISKTARAALGVKELISYFKGEISLDKAKDLIKRNTRRYAKRQFTWFRKDRRVEWVDVLPEEKVEDIAGGILGRFCRGQACLHR